jgi:hypothetical protein
LLNVHGTLEQTNESGLSETTVADKQRVSAKLTKDQLGKILVQLNHGNHRSVTHAKHARVVTPPPIVPKEHISADQKSDLLFKLFTDSPSYFGGAPEAPETPRPESAHALRRADTTLGLEGSSIQTLKHKTALLKQQKHVVLGDSRFRGQGVAASGLECYIEFMV